MEPIVSVIVPVYNTSPYLSRCLDSVCNQTLSNIEIICVNDCSADNSMQIIEKYAEKDSRISVIGFSENRGVSAARNVGIEKASAEFILFVDSDDWLGENYLQSMVDKSAKSGTDIVCNINVWTEKPDGTALPYYGSRFSVVDGTEGLQVDVKDLLDLTSFGIVPVYSYLYSKQIFDDYSPSFPKLPIHEDLYFQHEYLNNIQTAFLFCGDRYHYRQVETSAMHTRIDPFSHLLAVYKALLELYISKRWIEKKIPFISYRDLVEAMRPDQFELMKSFVTESFSAVSPILDCFSECERHIIHAFISEENYESYEKHYTSNIVKDFFFTQFREKVKSNFTKNGSSDK